MGSDPSIFWEVSVYSQLEDGTEISSLSDSFWSRECLEQDYPELSKVDIISIVKALEALSSYVTL